MNRVDGSEVFQNTTKQVVNRVDESEVFQKKGKPRRRDARAKIGRHLAAHWVGDCGCLLSLTPIRTLIAERY